MCVKLFVVEWVMEMEFEVYENFVIYLLYVCYMSIIFDLFFGCFCNWLEDDIFDCYDVFVVDYEWFFGIFE